LPEGAPLPFAPPCNRRRPFSVAGDRQGLPLLVHDPLQNEAGRKMGTLAAKILWYLNAPPESLMGTVLGKKKHNEINKWLDTF
jgi:hypothetical protein